MTSKTGNVKKYHVFCRMLSNALVRSSDAVFIDLLTMADLETLRARRQQAATAVSAALQQSASDPLSASASGAALAAGVGLTADAPLPTSASSVAKSNKRFLILTYLVEFDRCACVCQRFFASEFFWGDEI